MSSVEGYVFHTCAPAHPLSHVLASVRTLRRYDPSRPVALVCTAEERTALGARASPFERIETAAPEALAGVKLALDRYAFYERSLLVDSDVLWCRDPDPLWQMLAVYPLTVSGCEKPAPSFEGVESLLGVWGALRDRRRDALRALGLTHLPRVGSALAYVHDRALARDVCRDARAFRARFADWTDDDALAAALSRRQLPVLEARHGHLSPLLDYADGLVVHDDAFENVTVRYFVDPFVASLRTLQNPKRREQAFRLLGGLAGRGDHLDVTPFALRFASPEGRRRWDAFAGPL